MKKSTKSKLSVGQKLIVIQSRLRRGDYTNLASVTGYEVSHIRRVLLGESNNPSGEIVNVAYKNLATRRLS